MMARHKAIHFKLVGTGASCQLFGPPRFNWCFSLAPDFSKLFGAQVSPSSGSLLTSFLIHHGGYHDLFVCPC